MPLRNEDDVIANLFGKQDSQLRCGGTWTMLALCLVGAVAYMAYMMSRDDASAGLLLTTRSEAVAESQGSRPWVEDGELDQLVNTSIWIDSCVFSALACVVVAIVSGLAMAALGSSIARFAVPVVFVCCGCILLVEIAFAVVREAPRFTMWYGAEMCIGIYVIPLTVAVAIGVVIGGKVVSV